MNAWFLLFAILTLAGLGIDLTADVLDARQLGRSADIDPQTRFYQRELAIWSAFRRLVGTVTLLLFIGLGGLGWISHAAFDFSRHIILQAWFFVSVLVLLQSLVSLPFSAYFIFGIEERYGFNRTSIRTFLLDLLKGVLVSALLGLPLLAVVVLLFQALGRSAWLPAFAIVTLFQLFVAFIAPVVLMPLFNRFSPLPAGPLASAIEEYARVNQFDLRGIFTMDGSKRSSKANAFFTGFGRFRKLVLFDTLIHKLTTEELVAVFAHEAGHYRRRHITKAIALSIFEMLLLFLAFGALFERPDLLAGFGVPTLSVWGSLVVTVLFLTPIARFLSIPALAISRRHEFEADRFAAATTGHSEQLARGLEKLAIDHRSNPVPHPLKVALRYSHPPLRERLAQLRATTEDPAKR